jgi:microcystin-dependent protein
MGQPYVGEIRMFGGNFAPAGWMLCLGQTLPISENEVLFQLIGTTYGGDGEETFNLPQFGGRVPMHMGTGGGGITYQLGETGGVDSVTLTTQQIPQHSHAPFAATVGQTTAPSNNVMLASATTAQNGARIYSTNAPTNAMNANTVNPQGGSQPHENVQPSLAINYIISLFGVFPSPT